jgi:hypothetical protein
MGGSDPVARGTVHRHEGLATPALPGGTGHPDLLMTFEHLAVQSFGKVGRGEPATDRLAGRSGLLRAGEV